MSESTIEERVTNLEQALIKGQLVSKAPSTPQNEHQAGYSLDLYTEGEEGKITLTRYFYINHFKIYSDGSLTFRTLVPYNQFDNVGCIDPKHYPAPNADESPLHYYERMRKVDEFEELTCRYEDYIKFFIRGHVVYKSEPNGDAVITDYQPVARKTEGNGTVVPMKRPD